MPLSEQKDLELIVGYSFGVSKSSAPGKLNERIAEEIANHIPAAGAQNYIVGVQWEICDAFERAGRQSRTLCDHVVEPPLFGEKDIPDLGALKRQIRASSRLLPAFTAIFELELEYILEFPNRAAAYLNRILRDRSFFERFLGMELPRLSKESKDKSGFWFEDRELPNVGDEIGYYQARRLNRQILEAKLNCLPKAGYIATFHVADYILGALTQSQRRQLKCISVFGHPEHVSRCCRQTLESAWKEGIPVNQEQVVSKTWKTDSIEAPDNWDPDNSQQWIRSYEQWKRHEQ
ncbi:MAG: hypothetical protein GY850_30170 [bacterium]|nr:hypothetical protein [bacterium]